MIVNVIEPDNGRVLDPACGSGGMFVQSAHFIERMDLNPTERATFYGMEKNLTTIRLANMNLAVHGLEGNIQQAITYYEDPHELRGKCDFVMANPPFNVDEVDAEKVKNDPRLPYALPGVNNKGRVSNGNYLWISYFDSYLNDRGRAGFVMSSQASSAGGEEAKIRRKLIETDHVDVLMAIRSGFFYTRTVPCELWFLDKDKPEELRSKVLMIDARNVYRKVTRKINDFTPEQKKNLSAIVWLYRGQDDRFVALVADHLERMIKNMSDVVAPLNRLSAVVAEATEAREHDGLAEDRAEDMEELQTAESTFEEDVNRFESMVEEITEAWKSSGRDNDSLKGFAENVEPLIREGRNLSRQADHLFKLLRGLPELAKTGGRATSLKLFEVARKEATEHLRLPRYFWSQARWLQERFPTAKLRDVEGLVKLVSHDELAATDWSLTPGRYVGVSPDDDEEDFDFEDVLRSIHIDLKGLNNEAIELAVRIDRQFEELEV